MAISPLALYMSMAPQVRAPQTGVAPTDIVGAYNNATNQANTQYLAKMQQQNALWGGLAGLGGSALTAAILRGKLFGGAPAAATDAASGVAGAASPVATSAAPFASGAPAVAGGDFAGVPLAGLAPPAADAATAFDTGAAAIPYAADAGTAAGADLAGTVGTDVAATTAADAAATAGTADAGMTLADLLPFLFAA